MTNKTKQKNDSIQTLESFNYEQIKKDYYTPEIFKKIIKDIYYPDYKDSNMSLYREFAILFYKKKGNNISTKRDFIEQPEKKLRAITFTNIGYLMKTLEFNYFYQNSSNLYSSVARLKQLPQFPFSRERTVLTKPFFMDEYKNYIIHYDLFFDFDLNNLKNIKPMINEILSLIHLLIKFNLKCKVVFSGSRGFKILIENNIYTFKQSQNLFNKFVEMMKFKYLDTSLSFVPSKLMKIENSLVFKEDSVKIAFPLTVETYESFFEIILREKSFDIFNLSNKKILENFNNIYFQNDSYFIHNEYIKDENLENFKKSLK